MKKTLAKKQAGGSTKIRPVIGSKPAAKDSTVKPAPNPVPKADLEKSKLKAISVYKGSFAKKKMGGAFDKYKSKKK
jgi:hypothetical protein